MLCSLKYLNALNKILQKPCIFMFLHGLFFKFQTANIFSCAIPSLVLDFGGYFLLVFLLLSIQLCSCKVWLLLIQLYSNFLASSNTAVNIIPFPEAYSTSGSIKIHILIIVRNI